jgi:hypothetical protein
VSTQIRLLRGTAARWTTVNPVLLAGQEGYEKDTGRRKVGDGVTAWTALPYHGASTAVGLALVTAASAAAARTAIDLGNVDNTADANKPVSTAQAAADALARIAWARTPDVLIAGTVTRDSNGAATSAPVQWPDGSAGTYTAIVVSTAFPGAVDSYQITYGSPVTKTYTQPTITRDTTTGAATTVPAITVA